MNPAFKDLVIRFKIELERHLAVRLPLIELDGYLQIDSSELTKKIFLYPNERRLRFQGPEEGIHIDEDILAQKFDLIVQRIVAKWKNNRRIYARKTIVARIDKKVSQQFLVEHHLQTPLPGKYRYGLYEQGELVSIAVFSGGRRMNDKNDEYRSFELLRFCNKSGYNVIGGLSKLIKAFSKDFSPGDIMTYTDRDWNQHSSLEKIGFTIKEITAPITFWIAGAHRYTYRNEEDLSVLMDQAPLGFPKENMGSIKMILYIK
ncbi:hypothetical protein [Sphingobacterium athyrii]|uniref:Uncharacterized protein n=1 Tax=Sphingobacterium athyrii TaxID=2152717 RepID=A0A363NQW5_9SPHI|nr:hypothetical protein [Sphingobacterium athyrii]PUV23164.1 hypothetical protein DCO56_19855 [Sphingobacterium athyrii]